MKRVLFYLCVAIVSFIACDNKELETNDADNKSASFLKDSGIEEICGTYYDNLLSVNAVDPNKITIDSTGTITRYLAMSGSRRLQLIYYKGYLYPDSLKDFTTDNYLFEVKKGDIMRWYTNEKNAGKRELDMVFFKEGGDFNRKVSDGRWEERLGSTDYIQNSFVFREGIVDRYEHYKHLTGTYTHNNGVLTFTYTEGYSGEYDLKTLQLIEGSDCEPLSQEDLEFEQEYNSKCTFAIDPEDSTKAYNSGRRMYYKIE